MKLKPGYRRGLRVMQFVPQITGWLDVCVGGPQASRVLVEKKGFVGLSGSQRSREELL